MKKLLWFVLALMLVFVCNIVYGQNVLEFKQSPYSLSTGGRNYGDPITSVHEKTHGVNSKLRQKFGGNCYFIGDTTYVRFDDTPQGITLSKIANNCKYKGDIFNLYMVRQRRWWNDTPLYTFEEWVAYTNGSAQQVWFGGGRSSDCSLYYMMEMGYYSYVAVLLLPDTYTDKHNLWKFWIWHAKRNIYMSEEAEKKGLFSEKQKYWRDILVDLLPKQDGGDNNNANR